MANPIMTELYSKLEKALAEGDVSFIEQGPDLILKYFNKDGFLDGVEFKQANSDKYSRKKVIGEEGKHVIRAMRWPAGYELMPHEHHGRPCIELLVSGQMAVWDMVADHKDNDLYDLIVIDYQNLKPGNIAIVNPKTKTPENTVVL